MTSIVQDEYGPAPEDVLRLGQVETPAIGEGELLVRVRAAGVDRATWHVMSGLPYPIRLAGFGVKRPKHRNPGRTFAGVVDTVGPGVEGFSAGDEVYGIGDGTFAEFARVSARKTARKPAGLSFEDAAAVPISGLTALQAVRDRGRVQAGQKVLVIGASGGVGSFAVQIAKAHGAHVTGVASAAKADVVRALGADEVLDYERDDLGAGRYDVILDIAGNRGLARLRRALAPRGTLVLVGGETDEHWRGGLGRSLRAHVLSLFVKQRLGTFVASENAADLDAVTQLIGAGAVTPVVERSYPLADAPAAIRHLLDGRVRGKVVVTV